VTSVGAPTFCVQAARRRKSRFEESSFRWRSGIEESLLDREEARENPRFAVCRRQARNGDWLGKIARFKAYLKYGFWTFATDFFGKMSARRHLALQTQLSAALPARIRRRKL